MAVLRISLVLVPALAVLLGLGALFSERPAFTKLNRLILDRVAFTSLITQSTTPSEAHPQIFVLSEDPKIVYIKDFLTHDEAAQLVQLADEHFAPSLMWDNEGKGHADKAYRSSLTAKLPPDPLIDQLTARARTFPFYKHLGDFLPIVVQNYGVAGQYRDHFDWFDDKHAVGGNIASTFFVYIHANCTGGGTSFPRLPPPSEDAGGFWCDFIDCDRPVDEGTTFLPITGNAVYWDNLYEDGSGHLKTLHAGMPVTSGNKMGMNMWTWQLA